MNGFALAGKFHSALPAVRQWVEMTLERNREKAVQGSGLAAPRLREVFPLDLLTKAKVVVVAGELPFPPLSRLGLPELAPLEQMSMEMSAITYLDTFFVKQNRLTESLHFHELVHVVQWETLGMDDFLLCYGAGLIQSGYRSSPLEEMAYGLQESFDHHQLPAGVVEQIRRETQAIRVGVAPLFPGG